jgi:hypothetical protein
MAVYIHNPLKDTFINSEYPASNSGLDEILELHTYLDAEGIRQSSRILVDPGALELHTTLSNLGVSAQKVELKLYNSEATTLPANYTIVANPIATSGSGIWVNGVGKFEDIPANTSGVSWEYLTAGTTNPWPTANSGSGSFSLTSSYSIVEGGGVWLVSQSFSQSFNQYSTKDILLDISEYYTGSVSGELPNEGVILRIDDEFNLDDSEEFRVSFFSRDTNTIFGSKILAKWDDAAYVQTLPEIPSNNFTVDFEFVRDKYLNAGKHRLRLHARPENPPRVFTTSSPYLTKYRLPEDTFWALRDYYTKDYIVDFDEEYLKVSCDATSPYIDLYFDNLAPERFYQLILKVNKAGTEELITLPPIQIGSI